MVNPKSHWFLGLKSFTSLSIIACWNFTGLQEDALTPVRFHDFRSQDPFRKITIEVKSSETGWVRLWAKRPEKLFPVPRKENSTKTKICERNHSTCVRSGMCVSAHVSEGAWAHTPVCVYPKEKERTTIESESYRGLMHMCVNVCESDAT